MPKYVIEREIPKAGDMTKEDMHQAARRLAGC